MKKLLALLIVVILGISLCACESDSERAQRQAELLDDKYENAKEEYDQFQQDVNEYYDALEDLEKYN